ncbi:MAG: universal stress protein [Cyanomargarita calcarea GSE-NOS-MK-12-04C]|jgi:nucleotide-binding universal stress UspA family protein|uniref:Universal stress protein n=1 Tax=Cyanomargarita calcarea GSE-NOS-MK-12-04C TaxID=2839659 RepID=A0A951QQA9_9CYAN|nr:universal stress protein [Cyanomargarita calcarea GSE-NOS-MK-12-04C]
MLYNKILVALDKSQQTSIVFEEALEMAHQCGSRLMLFHCMSSHFKDEPIPSIGTIADVDMYGSLLLQHKQSLQKEIEQVRGWLENCSQQANIRKIPAEFTHGFGNPGKQICSLAKSWDADLIILGRRGHKGIAEILLGSVSNYLLHHAYCSVLVVQQNVSATKDKKPVTLTPVESDIS